ncbi:MAG: dTDP-4-dehydrorhamnose reductase [Hyphomonas sp.]|jgi:dTDP-4-dehydrorhamnose reductase|nr:dTDP-4-dehydrorhamnose reductase [Hyphomonas sp.]
MRIVVTGKSGQVVTALIELGARVDGLTVAPVGRPELDMASPGSIRQALRDAAPDVIVNAAAYTAVDQAEKEPEAALAVNGVGAAEAALAAAELSVPIIQISTDYVFAGTKDGPYIETDAVGPIGAYGWSKLAGEAAVAAFCPDHAILRTSWVYAAEGKNFLTTMLRVAATRPELSVVEDQFGTPTYAPDIADAVVAVARNLRAHPDRRELRGVFHMTGGGETNWAGFAEAIFERSSARGGFAAAVRRIPTSAYPTAARRPANSRLDCSKLGAVHGVTMPDWRNALDRCFGRLQFNSGEKP